MPENWKIQQWPQDYKSSVFIPIPKKRNARECSNYHTIALISDTSKVMLKIFQARLQQYMNQELPEVQAGFRKGRRTRDQIANIHWIMEKQENSRKTSITVYLTTLKPLTVWITTNWKILKEMGIPDHLTCLLRNLYTCQEATVRTGHGTTDWFQIRKGISQDCILSPSPCLLTYMQNTSCETSGLMKHKLESRFLREISITSDRQMTPTL